MTSVPSAGIFGRDDELPDSVRSGVFISISVPPLIYLRIWPITDSNTPRPSSGRAAFAGALRVASAEDIAGLIQHAGYVVDRAVGFALSFTAPSGVEY
jgi:hypothetical protein